MERYFTLDTVLRDRRAKMSQRLKCQRKAIRDSNPDFQINPDPDFDVCRIAPKILWIHYFVGTSRPVTVWEMLRNIIKSAIPQWWGKKKSDPESKSGSESIPKIITSGRCTPRPCLHVWSTSVTAFVTYPDRQTDRQTDERTDRQTDSNDYITLPALAE